MSSGISTNGASASSAFIYVFNDGGRFRCHNLRDSQQSGGRTGLKRDHCAHKFNQITSSWPQRCLGCSRTDLRLVAKCKECDFALCSPCAQANLDGFSPQEEPRDQQQSISHGEGALEPVSGKEAKAMFSETRTVYLSILSAGSKHDLKERVELLMDNRLGSHEALIAEIITRPSINRAWIVFRSSADANTWIAMFENHPVIDLGDGWKVRWKLYSSPSSRRVYQVTLSQRRPTSDVTICALLNQSIQEQLGFKSSDIDNISMRDGEILLIFAFGDLDVDYTRLVVLPDGMEASIVPTNGTVF